MLSKRGLSLRATSASSHRRHAHAGLALPRPRVLHRLVHGQDEARGLGGSRDRIDLHHRRLQNARGEVVGDVLAVDVDSVPSVALHCNHANIYQCQAKGEIISYLCVLLTKLIENVGGIEAGVIAELPWDDLESLGHGCDDELLLASNGPRMIPEIFGELHLDGAATSHDGVVLDRAANDHDGVVKRSFGLLEELLGASAENDGAGLAVGNAAEQIVPLAADLKNL
jgi:hypothetical protein